MRRGGGGRAGTPEDTGVDAHPGLAELLLLEQGRHPQAEAESAILAAVSTDARAEAGLGAVAVARGEDSSPTPQRPAPTGTAA